MSDLTASPRPAGVTFVAVLAWIEAALTVLGGLLLMLLGGYSPAGAARPVFLVVGIISLVIGLIVIFVARGLLHGSGLARILVTAFSLLSLGSGIFSILNRQPVNGILSVAIAVVIIVMLWSGRASRFFSS